MLIPSGSAHAVYRMCDAECQNLICWYINLQNPACRTSVGIDPWDHLLDIEISPDRSSWRWKDEEELVEAVAIGLYTAQEARAIRAEGERVIRIFGEKGLPFNGGWEKWSPPADWSMPVLPGNWDLGFT